MPRPLTARFAGTPTIYSYPLCGDDLVVQISDSAPFMPRAVDHDTVAFTEE